MKIRQTLAAAVVAAASLAALASPAGAGERQSLVISGTAECQEDGTQLVTFTLVSLDDGSTIDIVGAEYGLAIPAGPASVVPSAIPPEGTATAVTTVAGSVVGQGELRVTYTEGGRPTEFGDGGFVELPGGCTATATSTSTTAGVTPTSAVVAPTSTTAPPATAAVAAPAYTG